MFFRSKDVRPATLNDFDAEADRLFNELLQTVGRQNGGRGMAGEVVIAAATRLIMHCVLVTPNKSQQIKVAEHLEQQFRKLADDAKASKLP